MTEEAKEAEGQGNSNANVKLAVVALVALGVGYYFGKSTQPRYRIERSGFLKIDVQTGETWTPHGDSWKRMED